jgi:hypothetical protein
VTIKNLTFYGFDDVADLIRCMWPLTGVNGTEATREKYRSWLKNDRTKAGLLALQDK